MPRINFKFTVKNRMCPKGDLFSFKGSIESKSTISSPGIDASGAQIIRKAIICHNLLTSLGDLEPPSRKVGLQWKFICHLNEKQMVTENPFNRVEAQVGLRTSCKCWQQTTIKGMRMIPLHVIRFRLLKFLLKPKKKTSLSPAKLLCLCQHSL